jgi:cytochrome c-type biogenesis protein CcmE
MKSLKKKRRIQVIIASACLLAFSTGLIGFALRDGINLFRAPSQVVADPPLATEVFRLGGLVKDSSLVRGTGLEVNFKVTDGTADIAVRYSGVLPDLFTENQGMIATGRYRDGVFEASEILAKHDEDYMPKEIIEALREQGVYQAPDG